MAAPTLNTSLPHTPAKEWASITKDAINDKANPIQETQNSTVSTPGPYFPGAYPRSADKNAPDASETLPSTEQVKGVVDAVTGTALAYLPSREDTVGLLEKAKEYLPAAVQGYFPNTSGESQKTHPTSLPSQEVHGDTSGKSDGVGALPGELDEAGVAKLPDERSSSEKLPLDPHPILTTTNTLNDPPEALKARTHAVTAKDNRIEDLPVENAEGSPVSTLPKAPVRELGNAAVLQSPSSHHPGSHAVTAKDKGIVDSPLSKEGSSPVTTLPNAPVGELPGPTPAPKEPSTLPTNYGHMVNQQPPPSPSKASPTAGMAKKQESSPISPSSSISARSSEKTKASLLDKVKGEAKVITGKLSHNEEKVLEGKKLMGKTPST